MERSGCLNDLLIITLSIIKLHSIVLCPNYKEQSCHDLGGKLNECLLVLLNECQGKRTSLWRASLLRWHAPESELEVWRPSLPLTRPVQSACCFLALESRRLCKMGGINLCLLGGLGEISLHESSSYNFTSLIACQCSLLLLRSEIRAVIGQPQKLCSCIRASRTLSWKKSLWLALYSIQIATQEWLGPQEY